MIGRKRVRAAWRMASRGDRPCSRSACQGEVDHQDGVLLDDADQQDHADQGDDRELDLEDDQGDHRADPGRGQGGEHGQRVDVALIEDAQHQVDGDERRQRPVPARWPGDCWKTLAVPWKPPWMVAGMPISASAWRSAAVASLKDLPGARLKEMVVAGSLSWWFTAVGVDASAQCAMADSGTILSGVVLTATPCEAARPGGAAGPATAAGRPPPRCRFPRWGAGLVGDAATPARTPATPRRGGDGR